MGVNVRKWSCRPEPIVGVKVAYYGNKDVSGATLIVNVSPNNIKIRDAVFAVPGAGATAQTASTYIGPYRSNALLHGHMNPGSIMAGSSISGSPALTSRI